MGEAIAGIPLMPQEGRLRNAHILIVDDEPANVRLFELLLEEVGYRNVRSTTDSTNVLSLYLECQPDLILLDLAMPHLDGFAIMKQLQACIPKGTYLPILVLTGDASAEVKQRALTVGAKDFLLKSFDQTEVLLRIKNLLETRFLHRQLQDQNQSLEEKVRDRTRELSEAQHEILFRLGLTSECRDDHTGEHTQRVGRTSAFLAQALSWPAPQVELLRLAAPLHDLGKVGIPDRILLKPGKLTAEEFEEMKSHTTLGVKLFGGSRFPILQLAEEIALTHHEHWDGSGYAGLKGDEIPLSGRIVTVADVFDALTHERPYKKAWSVDRAVDEIKRQRGRQFDPLVVDVFIDVLSREDLLGNQKELFACAPPPLS